MDRLEYRLRFGFRFHEIRLELEDLPGESTGRARLRSTFPAVVVSNGTHWVCRECPNLELNYGYDLRIGEELWITNVVGCMMWAEFLGDCHCITGGH